MPTPAGAGAGKPGARSSSGEKIRRGIPMKLFSNSKMLLLLCAVASLLPGAAVAQLKRESLAQTPPMGWNSWNKFQCNVSEDLIKSVADSIATNGMKDAGYEYVVIDDCWQVDRDENGNIVADAKHFPSGIKALADYVHSKE
jgi:alpha-galactosidase